MDAKTRKINAALERQAHELARLNVEKKENLRSIDVARKQDQERRGKDSELTRLMAEVSGTFFFTYQPDNTRAASLLPCVTT